jgi:protocatechuate 3,4-dioxygenase beta subunit
MKHSILALALLGFVSPLYAAVTGTVMTPEGQPIAGARVTLTSVESVEARRTRLLSATPDPVALVSAQTDSKGNFTLESPKEPTVDLRIALRGYEPQQRRVERDEDIGAVVLQKVELKNGTVKANGKPVANAVVAIGYNNAEYLAKTDEQGRYEAPDPKRARVIVVLHPDYAVLEEIATGISGNIGTLDRTLSTPAKLTGKVVREDGTTPVAKATIYVDGWPLGVSNDDGTFSASRANAKWTTVTAQTSTLVGTRAQGSGALTIRAAKAATVTGRVLDSKTKVPVAGATARLNARGGGFRQNDTWWGAITDAKGNYTINAAPGTYSINVTHPAYSMSNGDVNLVAGQSSSKELVVSPLARVSGVVLNDEKKPVVAASISTQDTREGMDMPMRVMNMFGAPSVSGPDGRFSARVRVDTDLKLKATKKGFPPATSDSIKLAPGERRTNLVLSMPSGIAVTGKVTDHDGAPLSGVAVTSTPTPTGQRGMMQRMIMGGFNFGNDDDAVKTGSDGTYTIRVNEGTNDFAFRREGFSTKNIRSKPIAIGNNNTIDVTLDPSVEITGRVTRGGVGVAGVSMLSLSFGDGDSSDTTTGPDGSFTLRGLSPGNVRLMLRKEDEMVNDQRSLTAPAKDVAIELPVGTTVSGRVVDKSTHKPITQFQVGVSTSRSGGGMMMLAPPMLRSMTSDDGSFSIDNVPVGAINFVASAPGYSTSRMNLNAEEGKPIRGLEVELDTGVKLVGKVTGPDGTPLSDASVTIGIMGGGMGMNINRMTDKRTVTNSSGEYEIEALDPGEETVSITHSKYLPERKTVELKGREVRLDVQLSAGSRVSGMVVTESGAAVAEADVEAMTAGGVPRRGKTDASGRFDFDSLSPARYQFTASKNGYADGVVRDFDVANGAPVRIVMKSGGIITGFVRGLPESELPSTTVEARGTDGNAVATVDSTGAFRLEGVPSGTVTVRATMIGKGFGSRKTSPSQTVEMSAGGSRQVDIEFRSDTAIKGHVRRNGQMLDGAVVTFFPKPGSSQQTQQTVTADEQGNYTATGLDDGDYSVIVADSKRFASYNTTYNVHGSGTFDIDFTAQPMRGRVVDSTSNDPINEANITLRATGGSGLSMRFADRLTATDTNGTFNLDLVPSGTYTLTASKPGYGNDVRDITVTDGGSTDDVELHLHKEEGVTLKIIDKRDGRALSGNLVVFDGQGRQMPDVRSFFPGMGGGESTDDVKVSVSPGSYTATIGAMGYGTQHVSLRAPGTQTIYLAPAARIVVHSKHSEPGLRVRLLDSNGVPYPKWTVMPSSTGLIPSPGATNIDSVSGGNYTLQLLGANGAVVDTRQLTVADGQTIDVEI